MARPAVVGVDIGTSSSKGVLVDLGGTVLRSAVREHAVCSTTLRRASARRARQGR